MSRKIIGATVGSPLPKPNLMQTDPSRGDYVKGKEEFLQNAGGRSWVGKSAVFVGDSITASNDSYWKWMAGLLGVDAVGMGVNGSCVSAKSDKGTAASPLISRYTEIPEKDLIVIFMGTNDYGHGTPLGTIDDTTDVSFYGALNVVIPYIQKTYVHSRLVWATPLHRYGYGSETSAHDYIPNASGHILADYVHAIKEVCERYSIPVIDLFSISGFNPALSAVRTTYMPDGLHPNAAGGLKVANIMARWLNEYAFTDMPFDVESLNSTTPAISMATGNAYVGSSDKARLSPIKNVYLRGEYRIQLIDPLRYEVAYYTCTNETTQKGADGSAWGVISTTVTNEWVGVSIRKKDGSNFNLSKEPDTLDAYIAMILIKAADDDDTGGDTGGDTDETLEVEMVYGNPFLSSPSSAKNRISSTVNVYCDGQKTFSLLDGTTYKMALYVCPDETTQKSGTGSGWITGNRAYSNKWVGVCIQKQSGAEFDFSVDSNRLSDYVRIS